MEPISNVDRLVLLLRQRLRERDAVKGGRAPTARARARVGGAVTAQALASVAEMEERQLRRSLIQGLLSDQFGHSLVNEARFQQIVDRVVGALEADEDARALLERVTKELRQAGARGGSTGTRGD